MAWHGMAWHGMAWHGMACESHNPVEQRYRKDSKACTIYHDYGYDSALDKANFKNDSWVDLIKRSKSRRTSCTTLLLPL